MGIQQPKRLKGRLASQFAAVFTLSGDIFRLEEMWWVGRWLTLLPRVLGVLNAFREALENVKMPEDMTVEQIEEMRIRHTIDGPFWNLELALGRRALSLAWKKSLKDLAAGVARLTPQLTIVRYWPRCWFARQRQARE